MGFFDFLKKKTVETDNGRQNEAENTDCWPTQPVNGKAPVLMELLARKETELARQAAYLSLAGKMLAEGGHQPEAFQVAIEGLGCWLTLPGIVADRHGNKAILYSNSEPWDEDHLQAFHVWIGKMRKSPSNNDLPVIVIGEHDTRQITQDHGVMQVIHMPLLQENANASAASEAEPVIYIMVDTRTYSADQPWEQAAHACLRTIEAPIGEVDLSTVPAFSSQDNPRFDGLKLAKNPEDLKHFPKMLQVQYPESADLNTRVQIASNVVQAVEKAGCRCRVAVVTP